jgi:hypothetical protein
MPRILLLLQLIKFAHGNLEVRLLARLVVMAQDVMMLIRVRTLHRLKVWFNYVSTRFVAELVLQRRVAARMETVAA